MPRSSVADYLVQEEDGTSRFTKEEADGSILLEESDGVTGRIWALVGEGGLVGERRGLVG